MSHAALTFLVW